MFIFRSIPVFLYEVNGAAGGGDAGGQAVTDPGAQAPTGAQGDAATTDAAANEQFWGFFPDVPQEQRSLLEPHLKNVQAYVTRLQQETAPFKALANQGVDAQTMQGLYGFSQRFEANPLETWIEMARALQDPAKNNGQPVIHDLLDVDLLEKIARGEDPGDQGVDQVVTPPQGQGQGQQSPEIQQLMMVIQQQGQELKSLKQGYEQDKSQAQSRAQERALVSVMGNIRTALESEGFPKDKLSDDMIRSAMITCRGNATQAQKLLSDLRSGAIEGGLQPSPTPNPLDLSNGQPKPPATQKTTHKDAFEAARGGAADFLRRQNRAGAQG